MKLLVAALAALSCLLLPSLALAAVSPQLPVLEDLAVPGPIAVPARTDACMLLIVEDPGRCLVALASTASCPEEVPRRLSTLPLEFFSSTNWLAACRSGAPPG